MVSSSISSVLLFDSCRPDRNLYHLIRPPSLLLSSLLPLSLLQFSSSTLLSAVPSFIHLPVLFISLPSSFLFLLSPSFVSLGAHRVTGRVQRWAQVWSCSWASDEDMTHQPWLPTQRLSRQTQINFPLPAPREGADKPAQHVWEGEIWAQCWRNSITERQSKPVLYCVWLGSGSGTWWI